MEEKINEVHKKFDDLVKTIKTRVTLLNLVFQVESFEVWYIEPINILESSELLAMDEATIEWDDPQKKGIG